MTSPTLVLTQDDALSVLEYWHANAERLMLVSRRAGERLTRIGRGRIQSATARELRIDTEYGHLRIAMDSAAFEFGALATGAAARVRETQSDGLRIRRELDDWIFLRSTPSQQPTRRRWPGGASADLGTHLSPVGGPRSETVYSTVGADALAPSH
jgi:hypothetical protein